MNTRAGFGLAAILIAFTVMSLAYYLAVPPFEACDAKAHYVYAEFLARERRIPSLEEGAAVSYEAVPHPPLYHAVVALLSEPASMRLAIDHSPNNPFNALNLTHKGGVYLPSMPTSARRALGVARLVTWLGGLLCVVATWLLLWSGLTDTLTANLGAALVASNPLMLFQSTGITHDPWVAGLCALSIWLGVRAAGQKADRWLPWFWAGAACGAASLVKYSGLACAVPLGVLWLNDCLTQRRIWIRAAVGLGCGFAAVGGAWYGHNILLYRQLVPLEAITDAAPILKLSETLSVGTAIAKLPWIWRSFWGVFGYGETAPDAHAALVNAVASLGVVGCIVGISTKRWERNRFVLAIAALLWTVVTTSSLVRFMMIVPFSDQGRLLFAAVSGIASLLALGLASVWPQHRRMRVLASCAMAIICLWLALWPLPGLYAAYRTPTPIKQPAPQRQIDHAFSNGAQVIGIDLPQGGRIIADQTASLDIYWSCSEPIQEFHLLYVQIVDDQDNKLFYHDGLAFDHYTTPEWFPGQVFRDHVDLAVSQVPASGAAKLIIGMRGIQDDPFDERIIAAPMRIVPSQTMAAVPQVVAWSNGIGLADYSVSWPQIDACQVDLVWTASLPIHTDYSMSIQFLDASGSLVAQLDGQQADYPTSTWAQGDRFATSVTVSDIPSDWRQAILLLYDDHGARLDVREHDAAWITLAQR